MRLFPLLIMMNHLPRISYCMSAFGALSPNRRGSLRNYIAVVLFLPSGDAFLFLFFRQIPFRNASFVWTFLYVRCFCFSKLDTLSQSSCVDNYCFWPASAEFAGVSNVLLYSSTFFLQFLGPCSQLLKMNNLSQTSYYISTFSALSPARRVCLLNNTAVVYILGQSVDTLCEYNFCVCIFVCPCSYVFSDEQPSPKLVLQHFLAHHIPRLYIFLVNYRCVWTVEASTHIFMWCTSIKALLLDARFGVHFFLGSPDISYFISTDSDRNQLLWSTCIQDLRAVASI